MNKSTSRKPRIGDIIEVALPNKKRAYIQYVNYHRDPPVYGPLIRVLPGLFDDRPNDMAVLARQPEKYVAFFPVGAAVARGYLEIVGTAPVPAHLSNKWPLFKAFNESVTTGIRTWWLWDGKKSERITKLSPEHADLPMKEVINLAVLEDRLMSNWTPRDEAR